MSGRRSKRDTVIVERRLVREDRRNDYEARRECDLDIDLWLEVKHGLTRGQFQGLSSEVQMDLRGEYKTDSEWHWARRSAKDKAAGNFPPEAA